MNTTTLKILGIKKAEAREKTTDTTKYVRATFNAKDENDLDIVIKSTMSVEQFKELGKAMNATYDKITDTIEVSTQLTLTVDLNAKTKKGKLLFEVVNGEYNGYKVNYINLNVLAFINNKIVSPSKFKVNSSELFI